ncbi:phosphonatase-like hydrolase [Zobellia galactanivorans]|uniref:phosphonatase-like hydrolase n=1 Tax=Zobellia galactanivorans (strain DSM 12802 / CCUG 47099 / CIP 106680 / NCIMB 13871 / Dsij) TaxID=63186 RepID=UPI001C06823E|nr:phosphonatase-like hydrolase [Zobellia galactanivorans]MBU3026846.1 phosphonatase-like hydrolase [Zobellia galactanivorans]MDO6810890.1 phosphonatase-like hydrolase [Zobellia galactanivorans]
MHNIELAVFDMAGTVVNEDNIVYKTLQKAINKTGHELTLDFVLEHGAGKEKHQAIKDILQAIGNLPNQASEPIFSDFKHLLDEAYGELKVTSFEGVEEVLATLKAQGIKIALNTGYNKTIAELLLQKMNWVKGEQYDALVTADDVLEGRPNPAMISKAMEILEVSDANKVLKAGDSIIDIEEGKNANCGVTVGVTTGAHTAAQLKSAEPTYVLHSLVELTDYIKG